DEPRPFPEFLHCRHCIVADWFSRALGRYLGLFICIPRAACLRTCLRPRRPSRSASIGGAIMKLTDGIAALNARVSAFKNETEAQGKTFYPGASRINLASFPPKEHWDDWIQLEPIAGTGKRQEKHYMLVPTTCFNCESACGLLA